MPNISHLLTGGRTQKEALTFLNPSFFFLVHLTLTCLGGLGIVIGAFPDPLSQEAAGPEILAEDRLSQAWDMGQEQESCFVLPA